MIQAWHCSWLPGCVVAGRPKIGQGTTLPTGFEVCTILPQTLADGPTARRPSAEAFTVSVHRWSSSNWGDDTCSSYRRCQLDAQSLFQKASCTSHDAQHDASVTDVPRNFMSSVSNGSLKTMDLFQEHSSSRMSQVLPKQLFNSSHQFTSGLQLSFGLFWSRSLLAMVLHHPNGRVVEGLAWFRGSTKGVEHSSSFSPWQSEFVERYCAKCANSSHTVPALNLSG